MKHDGNHSCLKKDNDFSLKTCSPSIEERSVNILQLIKDTVPVFISRKISRNDVIARSIIKY